MKVTTDGKVGISEPIYDLIRSELAEDSVIGAATRHDIEDLVAQVEGPEEKMFEVEISDHTFSPDDVPMVVIRRGPISIKCSLVDLRRATAAFLDPGGVR